MSRPTDPVEAVIYDALVRSGIPFEMDGGNVGLGGPCRGLDFVTRDGVFIECKRFHSDRIGEQMSRAENIIAIQGMGAARFFAGLLTRQVPDPYPSTKDAAQELSA
jgi:hypothetical protein